MDHLQTIISDVFLKPLNSSSFFIQDINSIFTFGALAALGTAAFLFVTAEKTHKPEWAKPMKPLPLFYPPPLPVPLPAPQKNLPHYYTRVPTTHNYQNFPDLHYSHHSYSPSRNYDYVYNLEKRIAAPNLSPLSRFQRNRVYEALVDDSTECGLRLVCHLGKARNQWLPLHATTLKKFFGGNLNSVGGENLKKDKAFSTYQTAYLAGMMGKDCGAMSKACPLSSYHLWKHFLLMNPLRFFPSYHR